MIENLRKLFPIKYLLHAFQLAKSSFYYCLNQAKLPDRDAAAMAEISAVFHEHNGLYGAGRIANATGHNVKKVRRLMHKGDLHCVQRRKRPYYNPYRPGKPSENLLQRQFDSATQPNQIWLTDVTEFGCNNNKKLYFSPILDLFNREIIAYTLSHRANHELTETMLKEAIKRLKPTEKPMLHSDQGTLYRSKDFRKLLADSQLEQSMSRAGNCWDNAPMESFFAVLKAECFHNRQFKDIKELEKVIHEYIHYYNHHRSSLKLKLSPVAYRTQLEAAKVG